MTAKEIIQESAHKHGVRPDDITGDRRTPKACAARREAAFRMRSEMDLSLSEIGQRLDRHHTSVLAMLEKFYGVPGIYKPDPAFDPNQPDESGVWAI